MGFEYTKEQKDVIYLRDRNLLVSAAAGSGKTAVLVERICQRILDESNPMNVDQLLVVTFTNAAAAEMKARIMKALQKELEKTPGNQHLQRQIPLVHNAHISTIDSFCLNMVKEYFFLLNMEPGFRILDNNERDMIMEDAMNQVINSFYEEANPEFIRFVEGYQDKKTDEGIRDFIEKVYKTSSAHPWPRTWIEEARQQYSAEHIHTPEDILLMREAIEDCKLQLKDGIYGVKLALEECRKYELLDKAVKELEGVLAQTTPLLQHTTYEQFYTALQNISFGTMPSIKLKDEAVKEIRKNATDQRKNLVDLIKKMKSSIFHCSPEKAVEEHTAFYPAIDVICSMTLRFMDVLMEEKRRINAYDFSDIEHFVLELLYDEKGEFTQVAKECRKNYAEIMIDEYQDSNQLQESILYAISQNPVGGNNMFMVGDIKQSIYRFRQAEPILFLSKFHSYDDFDSKNQKIFLDQNFRSREQVLSFSNFIFDGLMQADLGGIAYDENATLKLGADFDRTMDDLFQTVLLVADEDQLKEKMDGRTKEQHEGIMIGNQIRELMETGRVWDSDKKQYREVHYSDIAILLRGKKLSATIVEELNKMGIPALAIEKTGYFQTTEIALILSMLRLIDNDRQDIPLMAVLSSSIGKLSKRQLGIMKAAYPEQRFFEAVKQYQEEGTEDEIKEKVKHFYEMLTQLKDMSTYLPVHELLKEVYEKTGYYQYASVMKEGELRKQNLDILVQRAREYEKTSYHGLFHFLRYVEKMQKYELEFTEGASAQAGNAVRLMTIHKSKGLEFPIVFVAGLGRKFNLRDLSAPFIADVNYKLALMYSDPVRRLRSTSIPHEMMKRLIRRDNLAEEIRVLYVALTRAKEKLILSGFMSKYHDFCEKSPMWLNEEHHLSYVAKMGRGSFYEWILPLVLTPSAHGKTPFEIRVMDDIDKEQEETGNLQFIDTIRLREFLQNPENTKEGQQRLEELFRREYHHQAELSLKNKMSVSDIKHHFMEASYETEEQEEKPEFLEKDEKELIPAFMGAVSEVNQGALRGTATHRVLECMDFSQGFSENVTVEEVEKKMQELVDQGLVLQEHKDLVSAYGICHFLNCEIGKRVRNAAKEGKLIKEQPFVIGITPKEAGIDLESEDCILVQGIIDVFFHDEQGLVLLDYKTDSVKDGKELVKRYQKQMELYKMAIERQFKEPVVSICLYSFSLKEAVDVL